MNPFKFYRGKQRFILLFFFSVFNLVFVSKSFSQEKKEINWMTWQEAVKAREKFVVENKALLDSGKVLPRKVFVDVYTSWCGWCKRMDATTFTDPVVVEYMNNNYWAVKMDAEMSDTIPFNNHTFTNPNPGVSRSTHTLPGSLLDWKLSYPSYVILDENLSRSAIWMGYKPVEDLLGILLFFKTNHHLQYKNYLDNLPKQ